MAVYISGASNIDSKEDKEDGDNEDDEIVAQGKNQKGEDGKIDYY